MSENIDGGGRRSSGSRLLVRPLLLFAGVAVIIGFVASRTDVQPYETPFLRLFFSDPLHMKAWLTTGAFLLGLGQLLTAARIYGKLRFPPLTIASSSSVSGHTMPAPSFTRCWAPPSTAPFPPKSS
jgi:hypothetical protein